MMTEGNPSIKNSRRQGAIGPASPIFRMTQANDDAKVVANGAAGYSCVSQGPTDEEHANKTCADCVYV